MSYATYTTEAIVCGSVDHNTSDRSYLLLTKRAGMVWATARSAREERSRQRYALQDFSHIRVSLVKGKAGWRIGSVVGVENMYFSASDRATRGAVVQFMRTVRRYVHGEEAGSELFEIVVAGLRQLVVSEIDVQADVLRIFTLRLYQALGYVALDADLAVLVNQTVPGAVTERDRVKMDMALTTADGVSHL